MRANYHKILLIFDLMLIIALTVYLSFATGMWDGYPIGTDAYAHLSKVKFMYENFPNFEWYSYWANGMPMFLWYSIVPYLFILMLKYLGSSYELSIQLMSIASIFVMVYSIYRIVLFGSKNRMAAFLAALVALTMPAIWGRMAMGEIPRLIGTMFLPLSWLMVIYYLNTQKPGRWLKFATIISLALAFSGHFIITGITLATILVIFYFHGGIKKSLENITHLVIPGMLLSFFTVLPFFISAGIKQVFGEGLFAGESSHAPTNLWKFVTTLFPLNDRIAWIDNDYGASFHWLVLPLVAIFVFLALHHREKHINQQTVFSEWHILKSFCYLSLFITLFGTAMYFGYPGNLYNASLPPTDAFFYLSLTLPVVIGLGFHYGLARFHNRAIVFVFSVISLVFVAGILYPLPDFTIKANDNYRYFNKENTVQQEFADTIGENPDQNYRFAHNNSFIAVWFNYDFNIPQIRDYYSQALLNNNEKFWFENAVFALNDNYQEVKYLLDWFGVKWLSVSYPNFNFDKFTNNSDLFTPVASNNSPIKEERISTFEYRKPSPIFAATDAKTILVIGDDAAYNNLLISLSKTDLGSDQIIPIKAEQNVEFYDLAYLQRFDAVMLYNFTYLEKEHAFNMLDRYVYQGGSLLIESSGVLSKPDGEIAFLPFPVTEINPGDFGREWDFKTQADTLSEPVNTADFGPAIYGGELPWSMLYVEPENLRDNAFPILFNHDKIVIAGMHHGDGHVIWSGLNMFYHFNNYPQNGERDLITNIINNITKNEAKHQIVSGELTNPQYRQINIEKSSSYTGVLLKENNFDSWNAYNNGQKTEIYTAGPNMMYVLLDKNSDQLQLIEFKYRRLWFEYLAWSISLIYFVWLIYAVFVHRDMVEELKQKSNITSIKNKVKKTIKVKQPRKKKK